MDMFTILSATTGLFISVFSSLALVDTWKYWLTRYKSPKQALREDPVQSDTALNGPSPIRDPDQNPQWPCPYRDCSGEPLHREPDDGQCSPLGESPNSPNGDTGNRKLQKAQPLDTRAPSL